MLVKFKTIGILAVLFSLIMSFNLNADTANNVSLDVGRCHWAKDKSLEQVWSWCKNNSNKELCLSGLDTAYASINCEAKTGVNNEPSMCIGALPVEYMEGCIEFLKCFKFEMRNQQLVPYAWTE
ncbi:secreted protein [Candidatus Magnetoovum chiemensis]|nr:secreted protein [Candidatus Magnetoovum chiemensis]